MSDPIRAWVPGTPVAQPRPRATIRGRRASVYNPPTADAWKASVSAAFSAHAGKCYTEPMRVVIDLRFPRPQSHYGTGRNASRIKPSAPEHHLRTPDTDNCAKAILDALNRKGGIGLWVDDSQVVELTITKQWADQATGGAGIAVFRL